MHSVGANVARVCPACKEESQAANLCCVPQEHAGDAAEHRAPAGAPGCCPQPEASPVASVCGATEVDARGPSCDITGLNVSAPEFSSDHFF